MGSRHKALCFDFGKCKGQSNGCYQCLNGDTWKMDKREVIIT